MNEGEGDEDNGRAFKRMRKGTKSCLSCRKRKVKCIYTSPSDTICKDCARLDVKCVPQGTVDESGSSRRRVTLRDRVEHLQSLVEQLVPTTNDTSRTDGPISSHPLESEEAAEPLTNGSAAPLMRLFNDPLPGTFTTSRNSGASPSDAPPSEVQHSPSRKHKAMEEAIQDLSAALPPDSTMSELFRRRSSWWPLWRQSFGLTWGTSELQTLEQFAEYVLSERHPCLMGTLLVSFAICTGDLSSYLPPVERSIVHNDYLASSEHGLDCLMALGFCYMNALQPQRAWLIYRRANTFLQLQSLHVRHRESPKSDSIFWQLMHADRWVSMMTGLPYTIQDRFCDLSIPAISDVDPDTWLHRHLAIVSGRVIDSLLDVQGPTLSAAYKVDEQIDRLLAQLPTNHLDLEQITSSSAISEKITRLYRVVHLYQLRTYVHLPFMLRSAANQEYYVSLTRCVEGSRHVLAAYLAIFESQPSAASDGAVLNFTAFIAAVILLLSVLGYGRNHWNDHAGVLQHQDDWPVILRTITVIKAGNAGPAGILCRKCSSALETITNFARTPEAASEATVVLPYFGTIDLSRSCPRPPPAGPHTDITLEVPGPQGHDSDIPDGRLAAPENFLNSHDDLSIGYQGPYMSEADATAPWFSSEWADIYESFNDLPDWNLGKDIDWLGTD